MSNETHIARTYNTRNKPSFQCTTNGKLKTEKGTSLPHNIQGIFYKGIVKKWNRQENEAFLHARIYCYPYTEKECVISSDDYRLGRSSETLRDFSIIHKWVEISIHGVIQLVEKGMGLKSRYRSITVQVCQRVTAVPAACLWAVGCLYQHVPCGWNVGGRRKNCPPASFLFHCTCF